MKVKILVAVTTLLMGSGMTLAAGQSQEEHQAHHPEEAGTAAQQPMAGPGGDTPMMPMHEKMQKMRSQMTEIHQTEDPDKRDALIRSHMEDMQGMMKMMQGMHGGKPMMGGPQGGMPQMMNRQQMMGQRMDMMQMMMDQMMQNQAASEETRRLRDGQPGMMGDPGMMRGPGMMGGPGMMRGPGMTRGPGMMGAPPRRRY